MIPVLFALFVLFVFSFAHFFSALYLFGCLLLLSCGTVFLFHKKAVRPKILWIFLIFNILFLGLYYPLYGVVLGSYPMENYGFLKYQIGVRSVLVFVAIFACVFWTVIGEKLNKKLENWLVVFFMAFLAINVMLSGANFVSAVTYLVNSFIPLYFALFYLLKNNKLGTMVSLQQAKNFIYVAVLCYLVIVLYSIVLDDFYHLFRPDLVSVVRERDLLPIEYGTYPGPWWTQIEGVEFVRLSGTFPDPIILGYLFATFLLVALSVKNYFAVGVSFVLLILTFSKGAWLLVFNTLLIYSILRFKPRIGLFWLFITCLVLSQLFFASISNSSAKIHYLGLIGGMTSAFSDIKIFVFGAGAGVGGNLASIDGEWHRDSWLITGSESGIGVVFYQLGVIGAALLFFMIYSVVKKLVVKYFKSGSWRYALAAAYVIAYFQNSLLQENCINSSLIGIFLVGVYLMLHGSHQKARLV